jgi:hypothetical protein
VSIKMLLGVLRAPHTPTDPFGMMQLIAHAQYAAVRIEEMAAAIADANDCDTDAERSTDELLGEWRSRHGAIIAYASDGA